MVVEVGFVPSSRVILAFLRWQSKGSTPHLSVSVCCSHGSLAAWLSYVRCVASRRQTANALDSQLGTQVATRGDTWRGQIPLCVCHQFKVFCGLKGSARAALKRVCM